MTLANLLTLLRLVLAPVILQAALMGQDRLVLALLALAALTDIGDGWVARRTGRVSRLGTVLDPVADKAVVVGALLGGALAGKLPDWLAWAYLAKEAGMLIGGAYFLARHSPPIQSNRYGKAATVVTFAGMFLLWLGQELGWLLILAGLCIGLWALAIYLRLGLARLRAKGA